MLFFFAQWQMMNCDPKKDLIWLSEIRVTISIFSLTELRTHRLVLTLCLVKLTHSSGHNQVCLQPSLLKG